ncbi:site-specific integrase [Niabella pedocola]|uniref:Site-specific integrase n=1 Tax=Niabella pedocola TaxID=1752077 RepID=A0ABS8PTH1_9BACT|nr:site-specific integrase [Niabella pedocola]MCD2424364.1 site-specific integrase [Niabella pedocola]
MSVSVVITLDTRRVKKKTGTYPVKLLVTSNSVPKRYQTIFDLSEQDFNTLSAKNMSATLRSIRDQLKQIERKAEDVATGLSPFTFAEFEKHYILNNPSFHQRKAIKETTALINHEFNEVMYDNRFPIFRLPKPEPDTILATFLFYISKLLSEHRIRTAANYQTTYNTIAKFKGNVRFIDINVVYLKRLEVWMLEQNYSKTTVGIYTRCLRAIFNEAIFQGIIKREKCYPFGRRLYQPPSSRNIKKALTLEDVSKIYYYKPECERERKAKDFWLFSYLANGINPTDIAYLKYKNIDGEYLVFERAKTENSTRLDPRPITVFITEDLQKIIQYWGNKDLSPNNYIFPILEHNITPLRQVELIELFVQAINDWMAKIRKKLGIEKKVTTYVARHTFSTIMKRAGVSTAFIQESLGHTNIKTTENYLDSFENKVKKEYASQLTAFKNPEKSI